MRMSLLFCNYERKLMILTIYLHFLKMVPKLVICAKDLMVGG